MKKYIGLAGICLALSFASCDDFLTVESPDEVTSNSFWKTASDVEAGLAATYSQLYMMDYVGDQWTFYETNWVVNGFREDIIAMGPDARTYSNMVELYSFSYNSGNAYLGYMWAAYYRGISYANQVIEKTADIDNSVVSEQAKNNYINEARFMRGYYHMQLLLNWEQIVLRDKYLTNAAELDKPLEDRNKTWEFIIEDLKAATALPESYDADNVGRATSGAAYAYLGWAYLTLAYEVDGGKSDSHYFTDAINAFDEVKGYSLVEDFGSMFDGTHKNSSESIFELQFSMASSGGAMYNTPLHSFVAAKELGGWCDILPGSTLLAEYQKEGKISTQGDYDSRLYATLFFDCPYFNDPSGRIFGKTYDEWFTDPNSEMRTSFRKFLPATLDKMEQGNCDVNLPLMRYANVLLMKAEALNAQGHPEQAIPLIDEVRKKHGDMPAMTGSTEADVQAQIEHERILEFPLENYRWHDLRRWNYKTSGKLKQALDAVGRSEFNENSNIFYPVPQTEVNANEAL